LTATCACQAISKHVVREVLAHAQFCHPHVVLFREVFLTKTHLGIALEYVSGGDLYQYVRCGIPPPPPGPT